MWNERNLSNYNHLLWGGCIKLLPFIELCHFALKSYSFDFIFLIMQHRMDASVKSKKGYLLVSAIDFGTTIQASPSLLEMISWDPAAAYFTHWVDMTSSLMSHRTSKMHSIWQRLEFRSSFYSVCMRPYTWPFCCASPWRKSNLKKMDERMGRKKQQGSSVSLTNSVIKRKKIGDTAIYNHSKINIGNQYLRWMMLRTELVAKSPSI